MKGRFPNIQYDSNFFTYHVFVISLETNTGTPELQTVVYYSQGEHLLIVITHNVSIIT